MPFEEWAWQQDVAATDKLVLVALARLAEPATGIAGVPVAVLVRITGMAAPLVRKRLRSLTIQGLIEPVNAGRARHYQLLFDPKTVRPVDLDGHCALAEGARRIWEQVVELGPAQPDEPTTAAGWLRDAHFGFARELACITTVDAQYEMIRWCGAVRELLADAFAEGYLDPEAAQERLTRWDHYVELWSLAAAIGEALDRMTEPPGGRATSALAMLARPDLVDICARYSSRHLAIVTVEEMVATTEFLRGYGWRRRRFTGTVPATER